MHGGAQVQLVLYPPHPALRCTCHPHGVHVHGTAPATCMGCMCMALHLPPAWGVGTSSNSEGRSRLLLGRDLHRSRDWMNSEQPSPVQALCLRRAALKGERSRMGLKGGPRMVLIE
jgi:hypothetical protein